MRFGRISDLKLVGKNKTGKLLYSGKCDCGILGIWIGESLVQGHTKSGGCWNIDCIRMSNQQPERVLISKMNAQLQWQRRAGNLQLC